MRLALRPVLAVLLAGPGCGSPAAPSDPPVVVQPAHVDSVAVQVSGTQPVQVLARVRGVVGDGCSTLLPITQSRDGSHVTLTVQRQRPEGAICIQIATLFDETVTLEGSFPPGSYQLSANDVSTTFTVP